MQRLHKSIRRGNIDKVGDPSQCRRMESFHSGGERMVMLVRKSHARFLPRAAPTLLDAHL